MSFQIDEADVSDLEDIIEVSHLAMQVDPIYILMFRNVSLANEHDYISSVYSQKLREPEVFKIFKVTDSKTGQMVGWTGLVFPHVTTQKAGGGSVAKQQEPKRPERMHPELAEEFFGVLSSGLAKEHGYEAEKDYRMLDTRDPVPPRVVLTRPVKLQGRSGTRILPSYQKRGLATLLSEYCSRISDGHGRRMFITARPAAVRMCEKTGFKEIAQHELDLTRFGGEGIDVTSLMLREAQLLKDDAKARQLVS